MNVSRIFWGYYKMNDAINNSSTAELKSFLARGFPFDLMGQVIYDIILKELKKNKRRNQY